MTVPKRAARPRRAGRGRSYRLWALPLALLAVAALVYLLLPRAPEQAASASLNAKIKGPASAAVEVEEWSDFQ